MSRVDAVFLAVVLLVTSVIAVGASRQVWHDRQVGKITSPPAASTLEQVAATFRLANEQMLRAKNGHPPTHEEYFS